jgi:DNA-binding NarL/FixJ family response regulator
VTITVAVADDHAVVREGVIRILADEDDISVVGSAANGDALMALVMAGLRPCVALMDLAMPSGGLELVARLHDVGPDLRILVYSMHPEGEYAARCLCAGASGYVRKGCQAGMLVDAIRAISQGRRFTSPADGDAVTACVRQGPVDGLHERLTNREYEVFRRLARGESAGEIAETIGLAVETVSAYRARVLEKLHVARNADLARYALEHALLD